jgi:hypothetical protein
VDQIQIDIIEAELLETPLGRGDRALREAANLVVMNTWSRGMPLSRKPWPTLCSFPYIWAVSMWR